MQMCMVIGQFKCTRTGKATAGRVFLLQIIFAHFAVMRARPVQVFLEIPVN